LPKELVFLSDSVLLKSMDFKLNESAIQEKSIPSEKIAGEESHSGEQIN